MNLVGETTYPGAHPTRVAVHPMHRSRFCLVLLAATRDGPLTIVAPENAVRTVERLIVHAAAGVAIHPHSRARMPEPHLLDVETRRVARTT